MGSCLLQHRRQLVQSTVALLWQLKDGEQDADKFSHVPQIVLAALPRYPLRSNPGDNLNRRCEIQASRHVVVVPPSRIIRLAAYRRDVDSRHPMKMVA